MRNPETNLEAPAPTLKSVGKAENPLTIIPTPGTAPYNQKETPSTHFFVERERVGRCVQQSSFLGGCPRYWLLSHLCSWSIHGTWHILGALGASGNKNGGLKQQQAVTLAPPSGSTRSKQLKTPDPSFSLGKE